MKSISEFENFAISKFEEKNLKGGDLNWRAICAGLYTIIGQSHISGDKDLASAAWSAWTDAGCYAEA